MAISTIVDYAISIPRDPKPEPGDGEESESSAAVISALREEHGAVLVSAKQYELIAEIDSHLDEKQPQLIFTGSSESKAIAVLAVKKADAAKMVLKSTIRKILIAALDKLLERL